MIRVILASLLLATPLLAWSEDTELFVLSYDIEKAGMPLASPVILVRADELGSLTIDEGEESALKLTFWVSPGEDEARVSTQVHSKDLNNGWEGTVTYSKATMFQFNDVSFRVKVEKHVKEDA